MHGVDSDSKQNDNGPTKRRRRILGGLEFEEWREARVCSLR